jgi:hypothetical protein
MIPPFDESGCLPPGVHPATLAEIEARFARQSEIRRVQMDSVRWMVELAVRAGVQRIVLNGSFVTDIIEPNDVDCVLLIGRGYPADAIADTELKAGLPFLDVAFARQADFDEFVGEVFAEDRFGASKGMIEVIT